MQPQISVEQAAHIFYEHHRKAFVDVFRESGFVDLLDEEWANVERRLDVEDPLHFNDLPEGFQKHFLQQGRWAIGQVIDAIREAKEAGDLP